MSRQFIVSSPGDEAQLDNSLDTAGVELTVEDDKMLIDDESLTELAPKCSRHPTKVE